MTRLEELKMAYDAACDAWDTTGAEYAARGDAGRAAWNAARDARKAADAWNDMVDDYDDAWVAYYTELAKTQEGNSND